MHSPRYWSPNNILTHNAIHNFIIGSRGTGKTFGSLHHCIKHHIKTGRLFIYLRRYDSDLTKKEKLLSAVSLKFPKYEMRVEGQKLLIRRTGEDQPWRIMGYCMPLSTANSDKSIPFDDVDYIIYDEFIISKGMQHYIRNEPELYLDFYNTVDRHNDRVRVFLLANSVSIVNPYFVYFKITPRKGDKIKKYSDGYLAVEMVYSSEYITSVDNSRFGQFIKGTPYYDYAVGNEFADDNEDFIRSKSSSAQFHSAISFDGYIMSLWADYGEGSYFIKQGSPSGAKIYALTLGDMQPNLLMIGKNSPLLRTIANVYMQGRVFFDSVITRDAFYSMLQYLNIR